jgi:hypothetical protein
VDDDRGDGVNVIEMGTGGAARSLCTPRRPCSAARAFVAACGELRADLLAEVEEAARRHPDDELLGVLVEKFHAADTIVVLAAQALLGGGPPFRARQASGL